MSLAQPDRLLGRSAEESILLNSYFASLSMGRDSPASVILIHGESGLGKTKLAETLRSHVVGDDGYFIQGKFDQLSYGSASRPYFGISSVFSEYFAAVEQRGDEIWTEVVEKLRGEIKKEDGQLLFEAIPFLRRIIGDAGPREEGIVHLPPSRDSSQHSDEDDGKMLENLDIFSESGSHKFFYLLKKVVSTISSIGDPIVCLIDDIQWASTTDIDALKAMMLGAVNPFVFIFTCRPGNHPFLKVTDEFEGKTEIALHSLKTNAVLELVAEILRMDDVEDCTSLANFILHVTNGNPFFIQHQMISLRDEGLIHLEDQGWVWDIGMIEEAHGDVLGNLVIMLSEMMKRLPAVTQETLKICSCIGSKTDLYILGLLLRQLHFVEDFEAKESETLDFAISMASQEGLLAVTQDGKGVTFTHDSVSEAAYSLLEPGQRAPYHLKLGQILHNNVSPKLLRKYLFTVAAQFARGNEFITREEDRIATARIFLSAGEKSMAASASPEAHFFLGKGIELLREDDWSKHYRLCCDIYMKAADTAAFQDTDDYLTVLLKYCKGNLVDFLNASYIQVRSMTSRDDPAALDVGLEALRFAGEKFPSQNLGMHTVIAFAQAKYSMRDMSAEKLLRLPPIGDKQTIATLRLMNMLIFIAFGLKQKMLALLVFRVLKLSLNHGISPIMPIAVALYSAALSRLRFPVNEAVKYGEIALTLQDELKYHETMANVTYLIYGTSFTFAKKLSDCLKPLQAGYDSGVKTGDISHAMSCAAAMRKILFFSGQRLKKVARVLDQLRTSMSEYNMTRALRLNRHYRNAVDYCLGVSGASDFLIPTAPDDTSPTRTTNLLYEEGKFLQMVLACLFCEHGLAWTMSEALHQFGSIFAGTIWPYIYAFYRGMAATSMLHASRSRHLVLTTKSCVKMLRKGRKKSATNLSHQSYLLEAEFAAFRKKYSSAEKFFLLSIEHATRGGVVYEHAYACERFGTYHILRKNHGAAYEQIREAHRLYLMWGSRPKCEQLKEKYPRLCDEELPAPASM